MNIVVSEAADVTSVEASSVASIEGSTVTVPVTVRNIAGSPEEAGTGLAAYDFTVAFDPDVINVTAVEPGNAPFNEISAFNIDNVGGTVTLAHFIGVAEGPHGDIVVANLVINAVGAIGSTSPLTLTLATLATPYGAMPAVPVHGSVLILGADFTATPPNGAAPLSVQFTDLSPGVPAAWSWEFGDGTSSSAQNPSHTYTAGGSYDVALTTTWTSPDGSHTQTKANYVQVIKAEFEANPIDGLVPLTVQFTDQSVGPGGTVQSWLWDFGDGDTSTEQHPSHTYASVGNYTVSLTVADSTYGIESMETKGDYVNVVDIVVEADMGQELGDDNVTLIPIKVIRAKDPTTGQTMDIPGGIRDFRARVEFDAAGIQVVGARGNGPFSSPSLDLGSPGRAILNASHSQGQGPGTGTLAYLVPRLIGSAEDSFTLTLGFESMRRGGAEGSISQDAPVVKTFRRGDANQDGKVTIVDALFIAQHLAKMRPLEAINAVNAAGVLNDGAAGDTITIADALFIAQYKALMRDAYYNATATAPEAPTSLTAVAVGPTRIDLTWTDNSANETGFRIERSSGGAFAAIDTVSADVATFRDTTVVAGTSYSYRVFAVNSYGDSVSNAVSVTTPGSPPPVPPPGGGGGGGGGQEAEVNSG